MGFVHGFINGGWLIFPTRWDYHPSGGLPAELCWTRSQPIYDCVMVSLWLYLVTKKLLKLTWHLPRSLLKMKGSSFNIFQPSIFWCQLLVWGRVAILHRNHLVDGWATNAWTMNIFGDPFPKFPGANKKIFFIKVAGPVWGDVLSTPLVSFTYTPQDPWDDGICTYMNGLDPKPMTHALKIMGHNHWKWRKRGFQWWI